MSRGESYGGGQSSLGYLFGSEEKPTQPLPSKTMPLPPYGIDIAIDEKPQDVGSPSTSINHTYPRPQGQYLDRPSTKVKSVPGGDSSLGYLFGDK